MLGINNMFSSQPSKRQTNRITINEQFVLTTMIDNQENNSMKLFKGIDIANHAFVYIYIKSYSIQNNNTGVMTKSKQQFAKSICPPIKWIGTPKIGKILYQIEIHQKYGPSLNQVFTLYKIPISQNTFYLLVYQFIKLLQKVFELGYVCHQLNLNKLVLHFEAEKTELYLLNYFDIKKKNQQCVVSNQKFTSIGGHLGLNASMKNDLQSMCYILIDIYTQGQFLTFHQINDYLQFKNTFRITDYGQLPQLFVQFYIFVNSLNHTDDINLSSWRSAFKNKITKSMLTQPYQWVSKSILKQSKIQSGVSQSIARRTISQKQQIKKSQNNEILSAYSQNNEQISQQVQQFNDLLCHKINKYSFKTN